MESIYESHSITNLTISTGIKTLLLYPASKFSYTPGHYISITNNPSNYMEGVLDYYDDVNNEIQVNVDNVVGSGTYSSWTINLKNC